MLTVKKGARGLQRASSHTDAHAGIAAAHTGVTDAHTGVVDACREVTDVHTDVTNVRTVVTAAHTEVTDVHTDITEAHRGHRCTLRGHNLLPTSTLLSRPLKGALSPVTTESPFPLHMLVKCSDSPAGEDKQSPLNTLDRQANGSHESRIHLRIWLDRNSSCATGQHLRRGLRLKVKLAEYEPASKPVSTAVASVPA